MMKEESLWTLMLADDIIICIESMEQVEESLGRLRYAEEE